MAETERSGSDPRAGETECGACGHRRDRHQSDREKAGTVGCTARVDSAWTTTNDRGCGCSRLRNRPDFGARLAPPEPGPKFVQITTCAAENGHSLYALDENGDVWTHDWFAAPADTATPYTPSRAAWKRLTKERL